MAKKKLPKGWLLRHDPVGGTGHGDEQFPPTLFRWGTKTVGHLWWKREVTGFWFVLQFPVFEPVQSAIDYAWAVEAQK